MSETIRDVVIRIAIKTTKVDLGLQEINSAVDSVNKRLAHTQEILRGYGDEFKTAGEKFRDVGSEVEKTNKKIADESKKAADALVGHHKKLADAQHQARQAILSTADAVGQLARGIVYLTVSNDDDMRRITNALLRFEGIFGIFRGGVQVMNSATRAIELTNRANIALAATTTVSGTAAKGAALSNGALAASNTAVGTTATGAAAGMTALQVAMGPISAAFLAVGAVVAGVSAAFSLFKEEVDDFDLGKIQEMSRLRVNAGQGRLDIFQFRQDAGVELLATQARLAQGDREQLSLLEKQRIVLEKNRQLQEEERKAEIARQVGLLDFSEQEKKLRMYRASIKYVQDYIDDVGDGKKRWDRGLPYSANVRLMQRNQVEVDRLERLIADSVQDTTNRISVTSIEEQIENRRELLNLHKEMLTVSERIAAGELDTLNAQRQGLATARERLKMEQDRVRSVEARFGRLDPFEQRTVLTITEKIKGGGDLLPWELDKAERFFPELVEEQYAKRGREAGAGALLDGIPEAESLVEAHQEVVNGLIALHGTEEEIAEKEQEILDKIKETRETAVDVMDAISNEIKGLQEILIDFKEDLNELANRTRGE